MIQYQLGSCGGGLVFHVFDAFDPSRGDNLPDNEPDVGLVVGRLRLAGGIAGGQPLQPTHPHMSEKVSFFNGLLAPQALSVGQPIRWFDQPYTKFAEAACL
jgi:hypothetical protein